jgi:RNA chaperone Hfq
VFSNILTNMPNSSHIPATGVPGYSSDSTSRRTPAALQSVSPANDTAANGSHESTSLPVIGPRKLVRPALPTRSFRSRAFSLHEESPILAHQSMAAQAAATESTHAEAFYFQKQVQAQTPMMIVLDDGEKIEGCIEWYDHYAIKVRSHSRMLIYKSAIKYIYKVSERQL